MRIIDISRDVMQAEVYPGDPLPELTRLESMSDDCCYNLSSISMCCHTGTHVDAPLHFIDDGAGIESCPPDAFIGECHVVAVRPGIITGEDAETLLPKGCQRLLIKGEGRAFFMDSAAEYIAQLGIKLIGTDSLSVGCEGNETEPHRAFLREGICILENLDLSEVRPGRYFLFAPPVKIEGAEAAPARAVLISDFIFWSGKNE